MLLSAISNGLGSQSMVMLKLALRGEILPASFCFTSDTGWENDCLWNNGRRTSAEIFFNEVVVPMCAGKEIEPKFVFSRDKSGKPLPKLLDHVRQMAQEKINEQTKGNKMIKYEAQPGDKIDDVAAAMSAQAHSTNQYIECEFNGQTLTAYPEKTHEENRVNMRATLGIPAKNEPFHPVTAMDALKKWDKGENLFTVEMGGLGPGYEQAIQILTFEIIRDCHGKPLPIGKFEDWGDDSVNRINEIMGDYSGAMVGAAKNLAYLALREGWGKTVESVPADRQIQITKNFPKLPQNERTKE